MGFTQPIKIHRPANETLAVGISFFCALYFYLPLMTIYLFQRGLDLVEITLMHSIIVATQFVAEVPTGILADRWGRKPAWVAAITLQLAGEVWFLFGQAFWEFAGISILAGLGYAFASGAVEALVYDTLPEDDRAGRMRKAMGKIMAAQFAGNLLAFLFSGLILAQPTPARFALAIGLTAASVAAGWVISWFIFEPNTHEEAMKRSAPALEIIRSGLALLRGSPGLRRVIFLAVFSNSFSFYLMAFFQPYFTWTGVSTAWFGPAVAAGSLLAALASRYAYALESRLGTRLGLLLGTGLPGIVYLLMALSHQPILAAGLVVLQFGVMAVARPLLSAYINAQIASESRATILSLIQLASSIYLALAGPLLGWVGSRSLPGLFALMGFVILAAGFVFRAADRKQAG